MSHYDRNNETNFIYEKSLHNLQKERNQAEDVTETPVPPGNQAPTVPERCRVSIKQQIYAHRDRYQVPTPEPRKRSNVNVQELRSQFTVDPQQTANIQQEQVRYQFEPTHEHNRNKFEPESNDTNDFSQTAGYDDVDYEPEDCYQDDDDEYDDSEMQNQTHEQANEELVDLSRRSMVPLHELIAYYQYIQQGSSSITSQEESSSAAVSRQSSSASQQTAKLKDAERMTISDSKSVDDEVHTRSQDKPDNVGTVKQTEPIVPRILIENESSRVDRTDFVQDEIAIAKSKLAEKRRVRANVVLELINSERDFVKHLKDVVEGYLYPARRHPEIFTGERINTIFANIEQLYEFQRGFLESLEKCIDWQDLAASQVGKCFLDYEKGFSVYHYYCNNHPNATSELQELYSKARFVKFFEACRVLQNMIDISLDGFLLTPIQKICKYPLQLTELLKNTDESHADYQSVVDALETMRNCANLANERKRRIEALADVMFFQERVENWFGPKLSDTSSILIHSGEVMKMNTSNAWSQGVQLYLFDHLLLYSKKDILLKRSTLVLKGRINMDSVTEISDADEYKPRRSFKIYCGEQQKWFVFITRSEKDKDEWIQAFVRERNLVESDESEGFHITDREIGIARRALQHRKHSRSARYRHKNRPDTAIVDQIDLDDANMIMNRTLSLPSCIHPSHVMNFVEDSKVVSTSKAPGSRSPNGPSQQSSALHHNQQLQQQQQQQQQQLLGNTDDQHPDPKTSSSQVNWFKKMGSKKLSKSQLYTINDHQQTHSSRHSPKHVGSPTSPLGPLTEPTPAAQLTAAQTITSDKAAIKYEELEKRHREHMSSEEQARLYRLNNDLAPSAIFSHPQHHKSARSSISISDRRRSASNFRSSTSEHQQQQQQHPCKSSQSARDSLIGVRTTSGDLPTSSGDLRRKLSAFNIDGQASPKPVDPSPAPSSFEATLVLSSGRVVRVREDAV